MHVDLWDKIVERLDAGEDPALTEMFGEQHSRMKQIRHEMASIFVEQARLRDQEGVSQGDVHRNFQRMADLEATCEHWVRYEEGDCVSCGSLDEA